MNPQEEALDLKERPLPLVIPSYVNPERVVSFVREIDFNIIELEAQIARLKERKTAVMAYLLENNIWEDDASKIEGKVRENRILDIKAFRTLFPEQYAEAVRIEKGKIQIDMDNAEEHITLKTVDSLLKPKQVAQIVAIKEFTTYKVVKK